MSKPLTEWGRLNLRLQFTSSHPKLGCWCGCLPNRGKSRNTRLKRRKRMLRHGFWMPRPSSRCGGHCFWYRCREAANFHRKRPLYILLLCRGVCRRVYVDRIKGGFLSNVLGTRKRSGVLPLYGVWDHFSTQFIRLQITPGGWSLDAVRSRQMPLEKSRPLSVTVQV